MGLPACFSINSNRGKLQIFAQLFLQLLTTKVRLDELDFNPQFFLLLLLLLLHALASLNKSCLVASEFCCLVVLLSLWKTQPRLRQIQTPALAGASPNFSGFEPYRVRVLGSELWH